jgi:hypothetical protein
MQRNQMIAAALALAALPTLGACSDSTVADATGASLSLAPPSNQSVAPGTNCSLKLSIERTGLEGPVAIRFDGLPNGVSVLEARPAIPAGADAGTFTLHADNDALAPGEHLVTVTAAAESGLSVSKQFRLEMVAAK